MSSTLAREIRYLMSLCAHVTGDIYDDVISYFDGECEYEAHRQKLTNALVALAQKNCRTNPLPVLYILIRYVEFQREQGRSIDEAVKGILIKEICAGLDGLGNEESSRSKNFMSNIMLILSEYTWLFGEFDQNTILDITSKLAHFKSSEFEKQLYLSFLSHKNDQLLMAIANHENKRVKSIELPLDPDLVIELCYSHKKHWLSELLSSITAALHDKSNIASLADPLFAKIWQLALIGLMNNGDAEISEPLPLLNKLDHFLSIMKDDNRNESFTAYHNEIVREKLVVSFCMENSEKKMYWSNMLCNRSALSIISHFCDLDRLDYYKLKQFLKLNRQYLPTKIDDSSANEESWDVMTYKAYCLITYVIDCIVSEHCPRSDNAEKIDAKMEYIKKMLNNLHPIGYRFDVLKIVFSCLFVRFEYFPDVEEQTRRPVGWHSDSSYFATNREYAKHFADSIGFICSAQLLNRIVSILAAVSNDLVENHKSELEWEQSTEFDRHVCDALRKWNFVKNLDLGNRHIAVQCVENVSARTNKRKNKFRKSKSTSSDDNLYGRRRESDTTDSTLSCVNKEPNFINFMLARPQSLLSLCLEFNSFQDAHKLIEMYDLSDTEAHFELVFIESLANLTDEIRSKATNSNHLPKMTPIELVAGSSVVSTTVVGMVETFLSTHPPPRNHNAANLMKVFPQLRIYDDSHSANIVLADILFASAIDHNVTRGIIDVAEKRISSLVTKSDSNTKNFNYITFGKNVIDIFKGVERGSSNDGICSILNNDKIPIVYKKYSQLSTSTAEMKSFRDDVNKSLLTGKSYDDFSTLLLKQRKVYLAPVVEHLDCSRKNMYEENKYSYLKYFLAYRENISKLMDLEKDNNMKNDDILTIPLHRIIGDLINKQNIPLEKIEQMCKDFKINFIHKLVLNYSTPIKCSADPFPSEEYEKMFDFDLENKTFEEIEEFRFEKNENCTKPSPSIVAYVLNHNWVVTNLLKKVHLDSTENSLEQSVDMRTRFLDIFLSTKRFDVLKPLYSDNKPLTALQTDFDTANLRAYLQFLYAKKDYADCLKIVNALPERTVANDFFEHFKNILCMELITQNSDNWKCLLTLSDEDVPQFEFVLDNLLNMKHENGVELLKYYAYHLDAKCDDLKRESLQWLNRLAIYQQISELSMSTYTWNTVYSTSLDDPETILQIMLDERQFELCLQWSNLHEISPNVKNLILQNLLKKYFQDPTNINMESVDSIISKLPVNESFLLCKDMILKIRDITILKTIYNFLAKNSHDFHLYENLRIGIELLSNIDVAERQYFWDLINKPLLILEQYLMNAKLDKLESLINKIKPILREDPMGDNLYYNISLINTATISLNSVDSLLRIYAAKSLDLRSSKASTLATTIKENSPENILQSLDSINIIGNSNVFIMPEEIPTKDQWMSDGASDRCTVCKTTIFSILIRRHHCRRCGRLVCYSCSRHRMQINGYYMDIKVRVCDECYTQTLEKANATDQSPYAMTYGTSNYSDSISMEWCLSTDPNQNHELRKEFVYEYAPDVNLCLSIMKLHSANLSYPRFLLDRCSELSRAAGNAVDGVLEIVSMRKTLLVSCAVICSRPLPIASMPIIDTALANTEYQLSVTDALTRLATNGCHAMMPKKDSIDTHYIRQLLKAEKWDLALEISTKFGFSLAVVLASWGKACLKSGCYELARQKFALCFKTKTQLNTSTPQSPSQEEPGEASGSFTPQRRSSVMLGSHAADKAFPALLAEIISILEANSHCLSTQILKRADSVKSQSESVTSPTKIAEMPLNIIHTLSSVQKIKEGDFSDFSTCSLYKKRVPNHKSTILIKKHNPVAEKMEYKRKLEPFFYNECIYYLTTYGSHKSLINFYLKYNNLAEAIRHCHGYAVDKEVFAETIFMPFLNKNKLAELLKVMHDMDNSWSMWMNYLMHACRLLEHKGRLEALLAVQIGIGDYVRAAITCAGLYTRPTQPPHAAALHGRAHFLTQARGHLQEVPRKAVNDCPTPPSRALHISIDAATLEKHISTICKQIEIGAFLHACETSGRLTERVVNEISMMPSTTMEETNKSECFLPTLFGTYFQKLKLAVILLICGSDLREGISFVLKLVKVYNLDSQRIFVSAALYFVNNELYDDAQRLCDYIKIYCKTNTNEIIDKVVESSIVTIVRNCDRKGQLFDELAELIIMKCDNISIKLSCYIECRLLKTAYSLAVQNGGRPNDLRRIMAAAERLGQNNVKNACMKKLSAVKH